MQIFYQPEHEIETDEFVLINDFKITFHGYMNSYPEKHMRLSIDIKVQGVVKSSSLYTGSEFFSHPFELFIYYGDGKISLSTFHILMPGFTKMAGDHDPIDPQINKFFKKNYKGIVFKILTIQELEKELALKKQETRQLMETRAEEYAEHFAALNERLKAEQEIEPHIIYENLFQLLIK